MVDLFNVISNITILVSTLLAILLIIKYNHLSSFLKIVAVYLIAGASIDLVSSAYYNVKANNLRFLHLFTLFEFVILSYLFHLLFIFLKSKSYVLHIAIPVTLFTIFNSIFLQSINSINSYSSVLSSFMILAFCIYFFRLILDYPKKNAHFVTLKMFIICLFFHHCTSIIVMFFGGLILDISTEMVTYIWSFRSVVILATKLVISFYFVKLLFLSRNVKIHE